MAKAKAKPIPICSFEGCKKNRKRNCGAVYIGWGRFCETHQNKATINGFLTKSYTRMQDRVRGTSIAHNKGNWKGKPILPRDVFYTWSRNNPEFLRLYKRWFSSDFDRKLTPSVNRMNSSKGYTLDNMEWLTNSQNSGLSGAVKSMKQKKAIYDLLGVNK